MCEPARKDYNVVRAERGLMGLRGDARCVGAVRTCAKCMCVRVFGVYFVYKWGTKGT